MKKHLTLLGVAAMATAVFAGCSNDEILESYQGEEISFRTRIETRATETNLDNLEAFKVYADADGYDNEMFINGRIARKVQPGSNQYVFDGNSIFWPTGVETIKFWAYGPAGCTDPANDISIEPNFTYSSQIFGDFAPDRSITDGGVNQKDFVLAYIKQKKSEANGMNVNLTFHHALSNIVVKAKCADASKKVYVKGAWLVNLKKEGILSFSEEKEGESLKYKNHMNWNVSAAELTSYGVSNENASLLSSESSEIIGDDSGKKTSLMLIPQTGEAYNFVTPNTGAYILLLCRVESVHDGVSHPNTNDPIKIDNVNNKHIHQLFPVPTDSFKESEYGYTCVAIAPKWEPGVKYTYNLEFCGHNSGAGVYPPENGIPDGLPDGVDKPTGKQPGDPVLDYPIKFTVDVDVWTSSTSNTPMN